MQAVRAGTRRSRRCPGELLAAPRSVSVPGRAGQPPSTGGREGGREGGSCGQGRRGGEELARAHRLGLGAPLGPPAPGKERPHPPLSMPAPRELGRLCHVFASLCVSRWASAARECCSSSAPAAPGALTKRAVDRAQEKWDGVTGQSLYFKGSP